MNKMRIIDNGTKVINIEEKEIGRFVFADTIMEKGIHKWSIKVTKNYVGNYASAGVCTPESKDQMIERSSKDNFDWFDNLPSNFPESYGYCLNNGFKSNTTLP